MPDDHSEVVPLLPIPNRTVKRLCADDSADSRVKVGHRQALTAAPKPHSSSPWNGAFAFGVDKTSCNDRRLNSTWNSRDSRHRATSSAALRPLRPAPALEAGTSAPREEINCGVQPGAAWRLSCGQRVTENTCC